MNWRALVRAAFTSLVPSTPRPSHALRCSGRCGRWVVTGYVMPRENRFYCERCAERVRVESAGKN